MGAARHPEDAQNLQRFVDAQAEVFDLALSELRTGRKRTHWMWFIFPQLRGLGLSPTSEFYGLASLDEARAYLAHPVLGPRLATCISAVLSSGEASVHRIFGSPDDMKLRSSLTLFDKASAQPENLHRQALRRFFDDAPDRRTLDLLAM
jgi:uncharacterized protein (DUF1810 family)